MQQGKSHKSIPISLIFIMIGAAIFPIMIIIGSNFEGWILGIIFPGLYLSIVCMGVGVVLGIIDFVEAYRRKRT